jgi:hypothetical protein
MNLYIKVPGTNLPAHSADIAEMLFGNRKAKLPVSGLLTQKLQGIKIWAMPLQATRNTRPNQRFHLRLMAQCPVCGKVTAAGRLAQHSKVHAAPNFWG